MPCGRKGISRAWRRNLRERKQGIHSSVLVQNVGVLIQHIGFEGFPGFFWMLDKQGSRHFAGSCWVCKGNFRIPAHSLSVSPSWLLSPLGGALWDRQERGKEGGFSLHLCCAECGPSVPPAGVLEMVWHLNHTIFTDLNTNGYCLIVSWFISQTSSPLPPAQLLQSKPLSLNRPDYYFPSKVLICVIST